MATRTALILGVDTADGAYLARLLLARGYAVAGTGGKDLLARLGVADEVTVADPANEADEVYDVRVTGAERGDLGDLLATTGRARVFVATDDTPDPAGSRLIAAVAGARATGRFVVAGTMSGRESRLGPGTSFVARIVAAAHAAADPAPADLAAVGDCGWTPEYVDPMWRMLQRSAPADFVLATGRLLGGREVARHAFDYFGHDATRFAGDTPAGGAVADTGPARSVLGWSATTWGRDLVRTLCEGHAEERAGARRA